MSVQNKVIKLSDRTHALKRSARYLGSIIPQVVHRPVIENNKIVFQDIEYVPAFLKIINEFIDNSIDEALRTSFKYANKIAIKIDDKKIIVEDNGRGIPIVPALDEHGNALPELMPELAWTELKAGSNFDDDTENTNIGQNGEGASLGVIFAKKFIGETCDGNQYFKIVTKNNLEEKDVKVTANTNKQQGTKITFYPDLEKLNLGEAIDVSLYENLIHFRLLYLAITYPEIDFRLNSRLVKTRSFRELNKNFFDNSIVFAESENVIIGVSPSEDGYRFIQFINGINVYNGGEPLDYVEKRILGPLLEKLQKKYKNIRMNDLKNKITLHVIFKNMPQPRFSDQIKSHCVNKASQFPTHAKEILEISKSPFVQKIYKNKDILGPIVDLYNAKMYVEEKKKLRDASKKKDLPAKYWPATKENRYLFLAEGDSAIDAIISEISRDNCGFFPLKGVPLNVIKDRSKITKNTEMKELTNILGIDLTIRENKDLTYENVIFATDMDVDGHHIAGILLGFFATYAPYYLDDGRIFRFITPLITVKNKKGQYKFMFTMEEYKKFREEHDPNGTKFIYDYKKGLGTMTEEEWHALFERFNVEDLLFQLHLKDSDDKEEELGELTAWLSDDSQFRKNKILSKITEFDINSV